ncbi:hypothetical protein FKP32DRAFT_1047968 [Trametes sanguinea]|nr:hypothetical protein FKP32DRAFT_1047968 [Trametes sanguinea]
MGVNPSDIPNSCFPFPKITSLCSCPKAWPKEAKWRWRATVPMQEYPACLLGPGNRSLAGATWMCHSRSCRLLEPAPRHVDPHGYCHISVSRQRLCTPNCSRVDRMLPRALLSGTCMPSPVAGGPCATALLFRAHLCRLALRLNLSLGRRFLVLPLAAI